MRVTNKMVVNNYLINLMRTEEAMHHKTNQATTGKRILLPSDDPAGTARVMALNTSITEIEQYTSISQTGMNVLNSTDDALLTVDKYLQRVYELVIAGATDSTSPEARRAMAKEVDEIRNGLVQVANTNIEGRYIFAGQEILNNAYNLRAVVKGDAVDLRLNPITLDNYNCQFKVKLNDENIVTVTLSPKTYDGTAGNTLDDLAKDIQKQLKGAGFDVPVYAKFTPDNKLTLYAGTKPPDEKTHTLVVKEGAAVKAAGTIVDFPAVVNQWTEANIDPTASALDDYYNNWTITITGGTGAGQTRTITDYVVNPLPPNERTITVATWDVIPDDTSTYIMTPPLSGTSSGTLAPNQIQLDPSASDINNFYNGMEIEITEGPGAGQKRTIIGYAAGPPPTATLDQPWVTLPTAASKYEIRPHTEGTAQPAALGATTLQLDSLSSGLNDVYNGATITVTNPDGVEQIRKILDYDGATQTVTLDQAWSLDVQTGATFKISDSTLTQLGFENQATTKEVTGDSLTAPIVVTGKYPLTGMTAAGAPGQITLGSDASTSDNYYQNWTVKIVSGTGAGQTKMITGYNGTTKTADIDGSGWAVQPDITSMYEMIPPSVGPSGLAAVPQNGTAQAGAASAITLDVNASTMSNFYTGWIINITGGTGAGQQLTINGYDAATKTATVDGIWGPAPDATSVYTLTPPPNGTAQGGTAGTITLAAGSNATNGYYSGWKVKITAGTGVGQEMAIADYNGASKVATMAGAWGTAPDNTSVYTLVPPVGPNQIQLNQSSAIRDFYVGMPITITGGSGMGETRTITAYDPESRVVTVDSPWKVQPDGTTTYSIDVNNHVNTNSKFKITVGGHLTQEINLDGGSYSLENFTEHVEAKIRARGGEYENIRVSLSSDNRLRIRYQDSDFDDGDHPMDIALAPGSTADILELMGFGDGARSESKTANYEGDKGVSPYEISVGVKIEVNNPGDTLFDSIFEHLDKISRDLRTGNIKALGNEDIKMIKDDMTKILVTQGEVGTKVQRLEKGVDRLDFLKENVTKLLSHTEDVDLSEAIMELRMQETAYQLALQLGARILPPTLMDYLR